MRNEFEAGENNPIQVLLLRALSAAYLWHPYGRAVIGNRADIEHVPIDKLQAFYKKFYQPDNAVLTVSGKIDEAKPLPLINDSFGSIPAPTPHARDHLHRRAGAGRRTAGDAPARRRHPGRAGGLPRPGRIRSGLRRAQRADGRPGRQPVRAPLQGAGRRQEGRRGDRDRVATERSRRRGIRGDREQAGPGGSGPHRPAGYHRQPREGAAEQGRGRPRADARAREHRSAAQKLRADRARP